MKKFFLLLLSCLFIASCGNEVEKTPKTPANALTLFVVDCELCNGVGAAEEMKEKVFPDLQIKGIDRNDPFAQELMKKFEVKSLPIFVFNDKIKESPVASFVGEITTQKESFYMLDTSKVGLSIQQELLTPLSKNNFDYYVFGDASAPIQITEFSDFQCPYCKKFYDETLPKLEEKYKGKIGIQFKNLPLIAHEFADHSARMFQCAGRQSSAPALHNFLFQQSPNLQAPDIFQKLKDAKLEGVDAFKIQNCSILENTRSEVQKQKNDAYELSISGTPSFIINGKYYFSGAYPAEYFEKLIDRLLQSPQK